MSLPRKLKNFTLFNDGRAYLGEVPEVTLPKLTRKTEDYRAGGMHGPIKEDLGMEGLEMQWTAAGYLRDLFAQWGAPRHDSVLLRFAGALQDAGTGNVGALEVIVRGRHTEIDAGNAKAGEMTEIKVTSALSYYKLVLDGVPILEIDLVNMVEYVNGRDLMADVRAAIGL